jgi:YNFM family putative membrane transporter
VNPKNALPVAVAIVLTFTAFYAPQPLLPQLAAEFGVSESAIALLITVTMVPLSIAPVAYGFLLESVSVKQVLIAAAALLAATSFGLGLGPGYPVFLALRVLQGLLLPAMLTGLMTYVASTATPDGLPRAMAAYVAATIAGGFLGRAFAGQVSELIGWQGMFALLGLLLTTVAVWLCRLPATTNTRFGRLHPRALLGVLKVPGLVHAYLTIFGAFFVFASLLNYLPFRITQLAGNIGSGGISLMYTGYLMGIVVALSSGWMVRVLGSERRVVGLGLATYLVATLLFLVPSLPFLFINMFLFCAGMFTIHSVLPGLVNQLAPHHRGVVNGLYISAYYMGGAVGSFLPGLLFRVAGWPAFIGGLALVLVVTLISVAFRPEPDTPADKH